MGMSTHITAFRDMDSNFKQMLEIKLFCDSRKVSYPKEVTDFFGSLVCENEEYLIESFTEMKVPTRSYSSDGRKGFEIDVKDIPKEVKTIRFYNSW